MNIWTEWLLWFVIVMFSANAWAVSEFRPGEVWLDTDGKPVQAHGGCILVSGNTYYWYGEDRTPGGSSGVSCYSSTDLYNWKREAVVFSRDALPPQIRDRSFIERPKVIFNPHTGKYVLWMHLEQWGYHYSRAAIAVSEKPIGPFVFLNQMRPIKDDIGYKDNDPDQQKEFGGTFRDMNLFVDDDGRAYVFYSSENNATMYVVRLNEEFTGPETPTVQDKTWARILVGKMREAPAPFKFKGRYYLITSGCTGWTPNAADYAVADNILGPWESKGNPCIGPDSEKTFGTQSTCVLPVPGKPDCFIFMADRWMPRRISDSRYVWLPFIIKPDGSFAVEWRDKWDLNLNTQTSISERSVDPPVTNSILTTEHKIDRRALVTRHNITIDKPDPLTPLSVGNGEFAFTADITGLQTFPEYHQKGMPLGTQSQWGWHTSPNPNNYRLTDILEEYVVAGRKVPYASDKQYSKEYSPAASWLRSNPHRLHLGQIGLRLTKPDGMPVRINDLTNTSQTLNLWTGLLSSSFNMEGQPVKVFTVCHPKRDMLAVRIESPLLESALGGLAVSLAFPYGSAEWRNAADWNHPERHSTQVNIAENHADFTRILDNDRYYVNVAWLSGGGIRTKSEHEYEIHVQSSRVLEVVFAFSPTQIAEPLPDYQTVVKSAAAYWQQYWTSGGAIDFSQCTDPRAAELERRVVLSQYLTAILCSGSVPPQETGLVCNSWFGKFHLEMHWWHAVHFALWDRLPLFERGLPWYQSILPAAKATAESQGYQGARWPKMTSPGGRESPSQVGVFLIWQQPHPIYYAELCYRAHPDKETLERYRQIVFETAEFMASYPVWDETGQRYVLGPALIPAQESYSRDRTRNLNPTFELAYWYWALETAQKWRQRLGLEREPKWDKVIRLMSRPNIKDGVYTAIETPPYTITSDHPSMLAAYGFVPPTPLIDPNVMRQTFDNVMRTWKWSDTWGWDYPMLAMTAARLGEPEKAVDALFIVSEKNRFLANGHNYQSARLPLYLPGNGGLLTAVAMMAAGWDGCPDPNQIGSPGFPNNGKWLLRWEGLKRLP